MAKTDDIPDADGGDVERLRVELAAAQAKVRELAAQLQSAQAVQAERYYADDFAMQCWLNETQRSCPNPLAGLKRLPKPHHSWPIEYGLPSEGGRGSVTARFSKSPVIRDFARITQSIPIDLNFM